MKSASSSWVCSAENAKNEGSSRCQYVDSLFEKIKPGVEEPDWSFVSRYLFRTMIEWSEGKESELGRGSFGDIKWKFEPKVTGGFYPYETNQKTHFYSNLFKPLRKKDFVGNTSLWKRYSVLMPVLLCMGFQTDIRYHKRIRNLDSPLTISAEMPDEIMISKKVFAGKIPADWRHFERVEMMVINSEDAVDFRRYIKSSAERAVQNEVLPALKTLWRLGCRITTKRVKMPEGPIWSWDETEEE